VEWKCPELVGDLSEWVEFSPTYGLRLKSNNVNGKKLSLANFCHAENFFLVDARSENAPLRLSLSFGERNLEAKLQL